MRVAPLSREGSFAMASSTSGTTSDFTDTVAWGAQTDVTPGEVVEKQRLVRYVLGIVISFG